MIKLVFLDVDGVLNNHAYNDESESNTILRRCVREFNLLLKNTGAMYVVSSAWRYLVHGGGMSEVGLHCLLRTHGVMKDRFHGITCSDEVFSRRSLQIAAYLANHFIKHPPYVILDDLHPNDMGDSQIKYLVRTKGSVGLTKRDRLLAERILNG